MRGPKRSDCSQLPTCCQSEVGLLFLPRGGGPGACLSDLRFEEEKNFGRLRLESVCKFQGIRQPETRRSEPHCLGTCNSCTRTTLSEDVMQKVCGSTSRGLEEIRTFKNECIIVICLGASHNRDEDHLNGLHEVAGNVVENRPWTVFGYRGRKDFLIMVY